MDRRPLYVLIGTMGRDGPEMIRFRSPNFEPLYVTGITGLGHRPDIDAFERHLYASQAQRWTEGGNIQMTPDLWHMEAVVAMKSALVNPGRTNTIGGPVQSVIITRKGVRSPGLKWVVEDGDPMLASDWEDLTVPLNRVRGRPLTATAVAPEAGLIQRQVMC